jgi:hypothetical protein
MYDMTSTGAEHGAEKDLRRRYGAANTKFSKKARRFPTYFIRHCYTFCTAQTQLFCVIELEKRHGRNTLVWRGRKLLLARIKRRMWQKF